MLTEAERAFPRRYARTGRFGNGAPRAFTVSPDGERVIFLRSSGPEDAANALWVFDVADAAERLVVAPAGLGVDDEAVSPAERSRRERVRESASGIVAYAADEHLTAATFTSGGSLFLVDLRSGELRRLPAEPGVFDPRPDPTGSRVAYVTGGALHVVDVGAGADRIVTADPDPDVSWGIAEFAAAEEMGRIRGFWWSPGGTKLAAARVDERPVRRWFVADPTDPEQEPRAVRYPVAGTANADVSLALVEVGNGSRVDVQWDREVFPYLARVGWPAAAPLTVLVQSRDQRRTQVLEVDEATGRTRVVLEASDPSWVELVPGSPVRTADGGLVSTVDADDTRRLAIDGEPLTRVGLQIRSIVRATPDVIVTASEDPRETHLYRVPLDGSDVERLTTTPGVHSAAAGGDTLVVVSRTLDRDLPSAEVRRAGGPVATIASLAEGPPLRTKPSFFVATDRELRSALLVPEGTEPERTGPLPVLLDPYGGPHHARVVHARYDFHVSQWFADRGFAVLVTDGRGTPGRGCTWERAIAGDLAGPVLQDQVDALHAAAERHPGVLDLERVAIRGWSFGGFLAALAVLERPDVVHAAIAGAPVTDWRLYDTHYTERYLGVLREDADAYNRSSILARAEQLDRPLLLIHGLADDNVVVAHTLRLSEALFEAGRDHDLVLLPNATHMTRSEVAVERRFDLELAFLRRTLDLPRA